MGKITVSVVIPTLKPSQISLKNYFFPYVTEVIVDSSPGRSKARNHGAKKAHGDFLLFIDDDAKISQETYVNYILDTFLNHPRTIVCAEHPVLSTRIMGVRKDLFLSLGGFDETFETGEDADFGFRAIRENVAIRKIPRELIIHIPHRTINTSLDDLLRAKNKIRYAIRYGAVWIGRNVEAVSPKSFLKLLVAARRKGLLNIVNLVTSTVCFYYYFLTDHLFRRNYIFHHYSCNVFEKRKK